MEATASGITTVMMGVNVAEIVIPAVQSGQGQLRARIVETNMHNETMGWMELGSSGFLCLRLWQRFRNDGENDASFYHQVWLEAGTGRFYTSQKQTIQFAKEVDYAFIE